MPSFQTANRAKANLDHIYTEPDPRAYFTTLVEHDYSIPDEARPVFAKLIEARAALSELPVTMVDVGCSYGVNAALQHDDLSFAALADRWSRPELADLERDELLEVDREFFANLPTTHKLRVVGVDSSAAALDYATEAGLLAHGIARNLEEEALSPEDRDALSDCDIITSTGAVGYVGPKTFDKLIAASAGDAPWLANFVLRMFSFDDVADGLESLGYETRKLEGRTFPQRRFLSGEERDGALETLHGMDVDTHGKEDAGHYHAELFISWKRGEPAPPLTFEN